MTALTGITLAGMALATVDAFLNPGPWGPIGHALVYLAGGVPTAVRALNALWRERVLDIDLLMIVAALAAAAVGAALEGAVLDRKSTRLNSSHAKISYAAFCLRK